MNHFIQQKSNTITEQQLFLWRYLSSTAAKRQETPWDFNKTKSAESHDPAHLYEWLASQLCEESGRKTLYYNSVLCYTSDDTCHLSWCHKLKSDPRTNPFKIIVWPGSSTTVSKSPFHASCIPKYKIWTGAYHL